MNVRITSNLGEAHSLSVRRMSHAHAAGDVHPTVHPHASLAYYEGGRAEFWCGATYSTRAGDLVLVPEGMPHYTVTADDASVVGLSVCTSCLASAPGGHLAAAFHAVSEGAPAVRTVAVEDRDRVRDLFLALEAELARGAPWHALAVDGYLAALTAHVLRADAAVDVPKGASVSARALAFITRRATDGISLNDVAAHVHRSVAHTGAVVKAETGRTVVEWITNARLAAGRQLLLLSDESIENVGARIGFESASHFHRVFKRHHGVTPAEWRRVHVDADQR